MTDTSKDVLHLSNFTRSGRAFFLYLVQLCPNLNINPGEGRKIQKQLRTITIVRDPRDVVPSSVINSFILDPSFTNFNKEIGKAKQLYVDFYRDLSTQDDLVVVDFNDLVNKPENTMEAIHNLLGIPFEMNERDVNKVFNEGIHIHTSKVYPEYEMVKELSSKRNYHDAVLKMNQMLLKKIKVI